jgi:hypothetical protein
MIFRPVFDMSWGAALAIAGMLAFPFFVAWTLASETITLYLLRFHRSFWRCLGNATLANLVSGAVGLVWQFFLFNTSSYFHWVNGLVGSPPIDDYQTLDPRTQFLGIALLLLVGWIGSVLLESIILAVLRIMQWDAVSAQEPDNHHPVWFPLKISVIINTVSYLGLFLGLIIF